jgi:hypothetical protein
MLKKKTAKKTSKKIIKKPKLPSGENPQIAKGDGAAPVKAYIDAVPGWKKDVCIRLDQLIIKNVSGVVKAVKWNTPFYGRKEIGWFVAFHCFNKYVKVTFFKGQSLDPVPPVESKDLNARYYHVGEDGKIDEKLLKTWLKQASTIEGWGKI